MNKIKKWYNEFIKDLRANPMAEDMERWKKASERRAKETEERGKKEVELFRDVGEIKILLQKILKKDT